MRILQLTLLFVLLTTSSLFAQLPCQFSWKEVRTSTGTRDFVGNTSNQPFQGPCLSYAFASAIETMYLIEYNQTMQKDLAVAYLDTKVFSSSMGFYKTILEGGFKIPESNPSRNTLHNSFMPGVSKYSDTMYSKFRSDVLKCINNGRGYSIVRNEKLFKWEVNDDCEALISEGNYMTVGDVDKIQTNAINTADHLKTKIINDGPVVMKVTNTLSAGTYTLNKFRGYGSVANISYHAYTLIGWKDSHTGTRWIIQDSWPGNASTIETFPHILSESDLMNLIDDGTVELYQVKNVVRNGAAPTTSRFQVDPNIQCPWPTISSMMVELEHAVIYGKTYAKMYVTSDAPVDDWQWNLTNYAFGRQQVEQPMYSSLLVSPSKNGHITVSVRAKKNGVWTSWRQRTIYLANGSPGGIY